LITNSTNFTFSPNGNLIAFINGSTIHVKDARSFNNVISYSCLDLIDRISWSPDSS